MIDFATLYEPLPTPELALTRTLYLVPAERFSRVVDVDVASLVTQLSTLLLCCTWYLVMGMSLSGVVQVTLRAGLPELTALVRTRGPTCEGTD